MFNNMPRTYITPTQYREPAEHTAAMGFASSILNGNTVEGGLRLLTYKSIYALRLVEELDTARSMLVGEPAQLLRLVERDVVTPDRVAALQADVAAVRAHKVLRNKTLDEQVLRFNSRLDDELAAKTVSADYARDLLAFHAVEPERTHAVRSYKVPVAVEAMEQVAGFDGAAYEQAARSRKEEAAAQREQDAVRREEERVRLLAEEEAEKLAAAKATAPDYYTDESDSEVGDLPMDMEGSDFPVLYLATPEAPPQLPSQPLPQF